MGNSCSTDQRAEGEPKNDEGGKNPADNKVKDQERDKPEEDYNNDERKVQDSGGKDPSKNVNSEDGKSGDKSQSSQKSDPQVEEVSEGAADALINQRRQHDLNSVHANCQQEINQLKGEIDDLKKEVADLKLSVAALQRENATLKNELVKKNAKFQSIADFIQGELAQDENPLEQ